jgi:hypothetical protein
MARQARFGLGKVVDLADMLRGMYELKRNALAVAEGGDAPALDDRNLVLHAGVLRAGRDKSPAAADMRHMAACLAAQSPVIRPEIATRNPIWKASHRGGFRLHSSRGCWHAYTKTLRSLYRRAPRADALA